VSQNASRSLEPSTSLLRGTDDVSLEGKKGSSTFFRPPSRIQRRKKEKKGKRGQV